MMKSARIIKCVTEFVDPLIYCRCSIGGSGQGLDMGKKKIEGCSTRKSNEQLACTSTLIVEHMQLAAEMWHW